LKLKKEEVVVIVIFMQGMKYQRIGIMIKVGHMTYNRDSRKLVFG
jgi:hypothetical protein